LLVIQAKIQKSRTRHVLFTLNVYPGAEQDSAHSCKAGVILHFAGFIIDE